MLIQTAERRHAREVWLADAGSYWPHDAYDQLGRAAMRHVDEPFDMLALRLLDRWRDHATFHLGTHLLRQGLDEYLRVTGAGQRALLLDRLSVSARMACSVARKLRANYTGAAFQVLANAVSTNIGFDEYLRTHLGSLALACTSFDGVLNTIFDQSTAGKDLGASGTQKPSVWVGASKTPRTHGPGVGTLCARFDGSDDFMLNANSGFTVGDDAVTLICAMTLIGAAGLWFSLGQANGHQELNMSTQATPASKCCFNNNFGAVIYNTATSCFNPAYYVCQKAASAAVSAYTCRQNGSGLSTSSTSNGTDHWAPGSVPIALGAETSGSNVTQMTANLYLAFESVLAGADLTIVEDEAAQHIL